MTVVLGPLVVEAVDPAVVTAFWSAALGPDSVRRHLVVRAHTIPKRAKNRVHLDIYVRDPQDLLALGAVVLAEYLPQRVTMADVEGNEFCAFIAPQEVGASPARVFAVCTDSAEPERIAAWWAGVVGARVGNGPDGTPRWLHDAAGWEGLVWKFVRVPDERIVPNRWQWSVRDHTEAVAAGAISTGAADYVDPDGNEFTALVGHPGGPISR